MSRPSALSLARENAVDTLETCLLALSRGRDRDASLLSEVAERYHILGLAVLLEDADPAAFAALLALAGQTEEQLRSLDLSKDPKHRIASRSTPFCDALTAGDLETARAIARLAPAQHQEGWEYEDDFLRFHFLHRLVLGVDEKTLDGVLRRWEEVLEGAGSLHLGVSRALLDRDAPALDAGLREMAKDRRARLEEWRKTPSYNEQIDATHGSIHVGGLAILRLAELRGMTSSREYDFMPSLARVPLGTALPAPGSWRQLEIMMALA